MSAPKLPAAVAEIGVVVSPFQSAVHEPALAVSRKASDTYFAPDSADSWARPPSVVS
jgi:hypothetical protein